jgi:D-alanyl-D-alanine carboxypeptidase
MLFMGWRTPVYGKTGYTRAAGPCFVGTAQKGKNTYIIAVFNCTNRWGDIKYLMSRYAGIPM